MIEGVRKILIDDSTVQSLIGQNAEADKYKVYPGTCPQPEKPPFIVLRRNGKVPMACKGARPSVHTYSFQVIIYHKSYDKLNDIESAVELALDQKTGTYESVVFRLIHLQNAFDVDYITEWKLHARVMEFEAMVNAPAVT